MVRCVVERQDGVHDEAFGPTVTVETFTTEDEAVTLANDTVYGLAGAGWSAGRAAGGASSGPSTYCSESAFQNQSSPGSKLRRMGWPADFAWAEACCDGELSQQPMFPQAAQRRRWNH